MVVDPVTGSVQEVLAANVRRLRIARHLSLSELARGTGMSKATLSGVENGRSNPTVETLAALAGALRVSLGALLEDVPLGEVTVVRASQAQAATAGRDGVRWRELEALTLAPSSTGLVLGEMALDAREVRDGEPHAPGARAHVYVLSGKVIAGPVERVTELGTGDYASFPVDVPHVYEAGRHPARALVLTEVA